MEYGMGYDEYWNNGMDRFCFYYSKYVRTKQREIDSKSNDINRLAHTVGIYVRDAIRSSVFTATLLSKKSDVNKLGKYPNEPYPFVRKKTPETQAEIEEKRKSKLKPPSREEIEKYHRTIAQIKSKKLGEKKNV